jgi:hypothetical protein
MSYFRALRPNTGTHQMYSAFSSQPVLASRAHLKALPEVRVNIGRCDGRGRVTQDMLAYSECKLGSSPSITFIVLMSINLVQAFNFRNGERGRQNQ